jgi:predicted aspartyl protease
MVKALETVFDTGAVNVISTAFANQLGLKIEDKPIDMGAIGGSVKVHTAHIDMLSIGDLIVRDQLFFVLDIPSRTEVPQMLVGWEMLQSESISRTVSLPSPTSPSSRMEVLVIGFHSC